METFPPADASRAEIGVWYAANAPPPEPEPQPQHEAPEVSNGPSLVCNACGVIRVSLMTPFCKTCSREIVA